MRRLIRHIRKKAEEVGSSFKDLWTQIEIESMKNPLPGHNTSPFGSKDAPPCPCCGIRMKPWLHLASTGDVISVSRYPAIDPGWTWLSPVDRWKEEGCLGEPFSEPLSTHSPTSLTSPQYTWPSEGELRPIQIRWKERYSF